MLSLEELLYFVEEFCQVFEHRWQQPWSAISVSVSGRRSRNGRSREAQAYPVSEAQACPDLSNGCPMPCGPWGFNYKLHLVGERKKRGYATAVCLYQKSRCVNRKHISGAALSRETMTKKCYYPGYARVR